MPNLFDEAITEDQNNLDPVNDEALDSDDFEADDPEEESIEDRQYISEPEQDVDDRDEEADDLLGEWDPGHPRKEEAEGDSAPRKKVGKEAPNKQKKDRFEFWQSRATKYQKELDRVKPWEPVIRYLEQNPQALQAVISGKPLEPAQTQKSAPEIKKPEKPAKPSNFSRIEALQDPESASAKYIEAYEDYKEHLDDYHSKREELREKELEDLRTQQVQLTQAEQSQKELYNTLVQGYNYTPAKAKIFMETMSDPSVFHLDNLVQFFDIVAGGNQSQVRNAKQQLMKERTEKAKRYPLPPSQSGSITADQGMSDEDAFNLSMFQEADKRGQTRRSLLARK